MAKIKKNVIKTDLTQDERMEFVSLGFTEKQIEKINSALKQEQWLFWNKAREGFITLAGGEEIQVRSGKPVVKDVSRSLKFTSNYATVTDRETAKLVFQSDAYREGRIKLAADQLQDEKEAKFRAFKEEVLRDGEMMERIKREIAASV